MFFYIKNKDGGKHMNQMEPYYVVSRTKEKDEEFAVIEAMSLDEAKAIFEVRHKADKGAMVKGEAFYIFHTDEPLRFDGKGQFVFPSGEMAIIQRL